MTLVRRGAITLDEAESHLNEISAEERRLQSQLDTFETQKSLAKAYLQHLKGVEATIRDLRTRVNLDDPGDRRRAVEALLQEITVETLGGGWNKVDWIAFKWLREPAYTETFPDHWAIFEGQANPYSRRST
jgi:hypothetical protein